MPLNPYAIALAKVGRRRHAKPSITVRLPLPLLEQLGRIATAMDCTRTDLVVLLLQVGCDELESGSSPSPQPSQSEIHHG